MSTPRDRDREQKVLMCRWGELAALRPIDIDFSRSVVLVQRVVLDVPRKLTGSSRPETGAPISRNTFRTRVWLSAIDRSGLGQHVRFHDLRGAHASWLLAGGAHLKVVMDRLGHRQITTTQQVPRQPPDASERALRAFEAVRRRRH